MKPIYQPLTKKKLIETIQDLPDDTQIYLSAWNGKVDTYTVADHVMNCKYNDFYNDFYGTPGKMDNRLFPDFSDIPVEERSKVYDTDVIFIGSRFEANYYNEEIDTDDGNNDNVPIKEINGEDGDPDLFFKINNFEKINDGEWKFVHEEDSDGYFEITYYTENCVVNMLNIKPNGRAREIKGECTGVEDFIKFVELLEIPHTFWI